MIRVLIVEDSPTARLLLKAILESDPAISVAGIAASGDAGLRQTHLLKPDLITMDIRMPVMDGYEATRRIMRECPTPIVMVSQSIDPREASIAFNALQAGALSLVRKPPGPGHPEFAKSCAQLLTTVKLMSEVKVIRRMGLARGAPPPEPGDGFIEPAHDRAAPALVVIGASTGGPGALNALLKALPADYPLPIVIVQHMSAGFVIGLVSWLQQASRLKLSVAEDYQQVQPGRVYFAPDTRHLIFRARGVLGLSDAPPVNFVRPSASVLFRSAAQFYGDELIGMLLTGMGEDGADGLLEIRRGGGVTLAQDENTSVVFGMPGAAVALNAVEGVLPLQRLAPRLVVLALRAQP